jgi:hypothetical protein
MRLYFFFFSKLIIFFYEKLYRMWLGYDKRGPDIFSFYLGELGGLFREGWLRIDFNRFQLISFLEIIDLVRRVSFYREII